MRRLDQGGKVDAQDERAQGASQARGEVEEEQAAEAEEEDLEERARETQ